MSVHADSLITFLQLSAGSEEVGENKFDVSLLQATGATGGQREEGKSASKLNKVGMWLPFGLCSEKCIHGILLGQPGDPAYRVLRPGLCRSLCEHEPV